MGAPIGRDRPPDRPPIDGKATAFVTRHGVPYTFLCTVHAAVYHTPYSVAHPPPRPWRAALAPISNVGDFETTHVCGAVLDVVPGRCPGGVGCRCARNSGGPNWGHRLVCLDTRRPICHGMCMAPNPNTAAQDMIRNGPSPAVRTALAKVRLLVNAPSGSGSGGK